MVFPKRMGLLQFHHRGGEKESKKRKKPFHSKENRKTIIETKLKSNSKDAEQRIENREDESLLKESSSKEEHRANALAPEAEEGRDKLR